MLYTRYDYDKKFKYALETVDTPIVIHKVTFKDDIKYLFVRKLLLLYMVIRKTVRTFFSRFMITCFSE